MIEFTIENLLDHPEAIPRIAGWHYRQWAHLMPEYTLETYREFLVTHYRPDYPAMFVAVGPNTVVGTVALDNEDMDTRPELEPWLASLYVDEKYRRQGIAAALERHTLDEAGRLGFRELYLYTPDREEFFLKLGWKTLSKEDYKGVPVSIMGLGIRG